MNYEIKIPICFKIELPKAGKLENITASEGTDAIFNLKITAGKPKPQVKWFIEEEEIIQSETYEVTETEEIVSLIIKNVKPENSGAYHAQVYNEAGSITTNNATLVVQCKQLD